MARFRSAFVHTDYSELYQGVMKFDRNRAAFIHQWYPFVEGYSREFITGILGELNYTPTRCLEPFAGSGTTPLELQNEGINCTSFEVSPFMHLLASVKLEKNYTFKEFNDALRHIEVSLDKLKDKPPALPFPIAETLIEKTGLEKFVFYKETFKGILDIKFAVSKLKDERYKKLFMVALASILLEVSNVFRNGKCVSYRSDWKERKRYSRRGVHKAFLNRVYDKILKDIAIIEELFPTMVDNKQTCFHQDVRKGIVDLPRRSVDLVITSPPYLNSRDYTDIYRLELWVLDLIRSYDEMFALRKKTLISHVQYKLDDVRLVDSPLLKKTVRKIEDNKDRHWNENLTRMIKGYFRDMDFLFFNLREKMMDDKMIYFNIANSAYCDVEIKVDEVVCELAEANGFSVQEIRKARDLKTSGQQKDSVKSLQESVIVIKS